MEITDTMLKHTIDRETGKLLREKQVLIALVCGFMKKDGLEFAEFRHVTSPEGKDLGSAFVYLGDNALFFDQYNEDGKSLVEMNTKFHEVEKPEETKHTEDAEG